MWERSVPPITLLNTLRAFRSSHHPPKKFASVPFLPSPFYKTCERSVPPITLRSPSYKFCERSVPPINLLQNLRAFRSSHHPPKKFASAPFLPSPSYKICERSVPPITLLKKLRASRPSTWENANPVAVQLQFSCSLFPQGSSRFCLRSSRISILKLSCLLNTPMRYKNGKV